MAIAGAAALVLGGAWGAGVANDQPVHFHGYGEAHAHFPKEGVMTYRGTSAEADIHRFVWGMGYEFSETVRMDSEVDFEHAAGSPELEYAHLEVDLNERISLRAGSLLMPVGPLNEFHEPPNFYSVNRPRTQVSIIPTSWQEVGAGLLGTFADRKVSWRAFVVSGLSIGTNGKNFSTMDGFRGGRSKGNQAAADDWAGVGRVELQATDRLRLGVSGYRGEVDQDDASTTFPFDATLSIVEADAHLRLGRWEFEAVAARTELDNAGEISRLEGSTIGEVMLGGYAGAAYHYRPAWYDGSEFVPFVRWETLDTTQDPPPGFPRAPEARRWNVVGGLAFYPHPQVAFKLDVEHWEDDEPATGGFQRWNLGATYMY